MEIKKVQTLTMVEKYFFYKNKEIPNIQIDYLLSELKYDKLGRYYYEKIGISEPKNTLIFFKYKSHIIGQGILLEKNIDSDGRYLQFDKDSISIFTKPISKEEIKAVWVDYIYKQRGTKILDIKYIDDFYNLYSNRLYKNINISDLYQVKIELSNADDISSEIIPINKSEKKKSSINSFERDSKISKKAITDAKYLCEFNSEHKFFISKYTQNNYVEAHHLIPIEFSDKFEYSLDVIANIISLCPVCHKKIHYANFEDKKEIILKLYNDRKDKLEKSGLQISIDDLMKFYGNI